MQLFKKSQSELSDLGAVITANEIKQQPELWNEAWETYQEKKETIDTKAVVCNFANDRLFYT